MPIAVSVHEKSQPLTTVQFYVLKKLKLGDQILELQELRDRYPHLRNLPNQTYNLNEVQVIFGQDCYEIHHSFEFMRSEDKAAPWAVKTKIGWAINGLLSAKQAAILATTATSIADNKLANQLSKWWDIEFYASNCNVTCKMRNNKQLRRWSNQHDSTVKGTKLSFVARGRSEVTEQLLLCNGTTQVPRTVPAERRNAKDARPGNHWHGRQRRLRSESWP